MSAAGTHWAGLLRAALLGTARQPPPAIPGDGDALARALAAVAAETAEATLLARAAVVAAYRRAARVPARDQRPLPAPAPAETRPVVPAAAAHHLAAMLGGAFAQALPEWIAAAADAGLVAPPELIPPLLDTAAQQVRLRPRLAEVAGERGRWLAAQRKEWGFLSGGNAMGDELRAAWETAAAEHRAELLAGIRRRDPALGLELLRSTWDKEAPRTRPGLVDALASGLSMDDEPFLESVLDARSKELRAAASGLLARLAESRLVARMTERARQAISISSGKSGLLARLTGGRGPAIEVNLPETRDKKMERDGITPTPPGRIGERAWWLLQIVAAVPPGTWSAAASAPPAALIATAETAGFRDVLVPAWAAAVVRHRDAEWAEALIPHVEARAWPLPGVYATRAELVRLLSPERAETVVLAALERTAKLTPEGRMMAESLGHPWSARLTREVLRRADPSEPGGDGYVARLLLAATAERMDPAAALAEIAARPDTLRGPWADLLHHRHAMLEALKR